MTDQIKKKHSNVFTFYLQPLDQKFKCLPLHILSHSTGFAYPGVISTAQSIIDVLKKEGINVMWVATDGDDGYDDKADETLLKYIEIFEKEGFQSAIKKIVNLNEVV